MELACNYSNNHRGLSWQLAFKPELWCQINSMIFFRLNVNNEQPYELKEIINCLVTITQTTN